MHKTHQP